MAQIYEKNLWGANADTFYSGDGSHDSELVVPYVNAIVSFLNSFEEPLTVCDLGCGDFNIGRQLVPYASRYVGVDIVSDLIAYNQKTFKEKNLEFKCLNIAIDNLPDGDCAIIRQVFQHLSNTEVQNILNNLSLYTYLILTEHIPENEYVPNIDIISGQGTRLKKNSGISITEAPFLFKAKQQKELLVQVSPTRKGVIKTTLYKLS